MFETQKKQNEFCPVVDRIHRMYVHGIDANASFILGFDGEKGSVDETMIQVIEEACTIGDVAFSHSLLVARPLEASNILIVVTSIPLIGPAIGFESGPHPHQFDVHSPDGYVVGINRNCRHRGGKAESQLQEPATPQIAWLDKVSRHVQIWFVVGRSIRYV